MTGGIATRALRTRRDRPGDGRGLRLRADCRECARRSRNAARTAAPRCGRAWRPGRREVGVEIPAVAERLSVAAGKMRRAPVERGRANARRSACRGPARREGLAGSRGWECGELAQQHAMASLRFAAASRRPPISTVHSPRVPRGAARRGLAAAVAAGAAVPAAGRAAADAAKCRSRSRRESARPLDRARHVNVDLDLVRAFPPSRARVLIRNGSYERKYLLARSRGHRDRAGGHGSASGGHRSPAVAIGARLAGPRARGGH